MTAASSRDGGCPIRAAAAPSPPPAGAVLSQQALRGAAGGGVGKMAAVSLRLGDLVW